MWVSCHIWILDSCCNEYVYITEHAHILNIVHRMQNLFDHCQTSFAINRFIIKFYSH